VNKSFLLALILCLGGLTASALTLSTSSAQSATGEDPLFARMEGRWNGQGRTTQLVAEVNSSLSEVNGQERLVSQNQVTETAAAGTPQSYSSVYWIEVKPGQPGQYILGADQGSTSSGSLSKDGDLTVFVSDQALGNDYNIHSETQFNDLGPLFTETTTNGSQVILKSVIQYTRQ
jgi:hypothetical protein